MKTHAFLLLGALSIATLAPLPASTDASAPGSVAPAYPLATCVVTGEALGSMGEAYVHLHKEEGKPDREVRLCCKGCLKKFAKDPAKYLAKLDAAKAEAGKPPASDAGAPAGH